MISKAKFAKFVNDNIVAITVIPLLIGIHWSWLKLQNIPELVDPRDKKDLPILTGAKYLEESILGMTESNEKRN